MGAEVRVFGSIVVTMEGQRLGPRDFGGRKPKQLLEILVLSSGRYVPKDRLAHLLWGEDLPNDAAGSLEHYVSLLRRRLAPAGTRSSSVIVTDHGGYRFDATRAWVDLTEFDALYDAAMASSDRPAMERALTLATGELLEDEPYTEWALAARRDTSQRRLQLHVATGELALAEGDHTTAAAHARDALALEALNEAAVRLLMTASYHAGEQTRALRVFEEFRRTLAADVGADPMPETRALHEAVLRQARSAGPALPRAVRPVTLPVTLPVTPPVTPPVALPDTTPDTAIDGTREPAARRPSPLPTQRTRATSVTAGRSTPARSAEGAEAPRRLVGRDRQIAAVLALHADPSVETALRSVVVDGELGVGKTALLDELEIRLAPQRMVRVRCTEDTRSVGGSVLEEVLGALLSADAPTVHDLVDRLVVGSGGPAPVPLPALRRLESELAGTGSFVVLVDDADLADDRSLQVLAAVGRRRGAGRGTVVLAVDLARLPHGHLLQRYSPDVRIALEPLGRQHLLALGVPDVHELTGGLPLLVAGCAPVPGDGAQPARTVSPEVSERVLSRLRAGDERTWRVVVACSVAGETFGAEEVARLSGMDVLDVAEIQERLCRERVLVEAGEGHRFRYPLVRQIVVETVPRGRRRLLLRRLRLAPTAADRRGCVGSPPNGVERRMDPDRRQAPRLDVRSSDDDSAMQVPV